MRLQSWGAVVLLDLTPSAAQHFGALTARISGHKLAVMIDGTITSAPIIKGTIVGGHLSITPGGTDFAAQEREALTLSASLNAHAAR